MSLEDPFFVVKDEVLKALLKTRELFERWRSVDDGREIRSMEEQEWAATELRNSLRSIEWDLEDLEDTVQIVEKNPAKFRIDPTELTVRKSFIAQTREEVKQMKLRTSQDRNDAQMDTVNLGSPGGGGGTQVQPSGSKKYSRLPNETDSPTNAGQNHHQIAMGDQDGQLTIMSESSSAAGNISQQIGSDADEQAVMLDEFGTEIENAETKLDATMRKMAKVLHMSNDRRQWVAVGVLSGAVFVVLMLLFAL